MEGFGRRTYDGSREPGTSRDIAVDRGVGICSLLGFQPPLARRPWFAACLAAACALPAACGRGSAGAPAAPAAPPALGAAARPRNLVIVVLDTLRPDHLPFYGSSRDTSPRLAELAKDSFVFQNAQSAAPTTAASLLTLMTSLYPEVHQVQGTDPPARMSENVTTLAEVLASHGYSTAAFTEGAYAYPGFGLGQGFQVYPPHPDAGDPNLPPGLAQSRLHGNVDRTIAWLRTQRRDPFFLFFHTYEIHSPYWTRDEYVRLFRPEYDEAADHARVARVIERWNREHEASPEDCLAMLEHLYQCPLIDLPSLTDPDGFDAAASRFHCGAADAVTCAPLLGLVRDLYDASIRYTDHELERLWNALDELHLTDDTVIVVASDHGEGLGQHHEMQHSNVLFDEAVRVLLMVHVPGGELAPRRIPQMVRTVDVMPTVLDLLHVEDPTWRTEGRSLLPLMRGEPDPERVAYSHARRIGPDQNPQYTVRAGTWRLISEPAVHRSWLYDLAADPGELADVAAQHPDVVARLEGLLATQAEVDLRLRREIDTVARPAGIDAETRRELHEIGYVGPAPSAAPSNPSAGAMGSAWRTGTPLAPPDREPRDPR
jgi:arylsulfatase A-like enzyme